MVTFLEDLLGKEKEKECRQIFKIPVGWDGALNLRRVYEARFGIVLLPRKD